MRRSSLKEDSGDHSSSRAAKRPVLFMAHSTALTFSVAVSRKRVEEGVNRVFPETCYRFFRLAVVAALVQASAASAQDRLALVIGQGAYQGRSLPTTVNDAGLIAQTLTSAGSRSSRAAISAPTICAASCATSSTRSGSEPGSTVMVYLAGHGVQLEGENYLLPVDARIERDVDMPIEGFPRLRPRPLPRAQPAAGAVIVADMARDYPLGSSGEPVAAKGLAPHGAACWVP